MQIRRLKTSSDEELINHIKNGLADHEEEYVVGSWENFNKKEKKRPAIILWMGGIGAAAAVLLIGFALFFNENSKEKTISGDNGIAKTAPLEVDEPTISDNNIDSSNDRIQPEPTERISTASTALIGKKEAIVTNSNLAVINPAPDPLRLTPPLIAANAIVKQPDPLVQQQNSVVKQPDPVAVVTADPTDNIAKKPITLDAFLAKENELNTSKKTTGEKQTLTNKWDLGVVVAPSFGNTTDKLNMGYGVSMAYNLNSKVSVGSGISYNEMGASKDIIGSSAPNSPSANALVSDTKSLESVNTRVSGIDIPLEVRYNLSSRFYANVGVSAFAVINQQQNNVYLRGTVIQETTLNLAGDVKPQSFLRTEKVSEKATETLSPNSRLIGFYNFSFGYRQKLSKDKSIGIEPFMKVPMKDVTKENLRLLGTGLKIKFDF
jgi:cytoskeletal protein RodZ